MIAPPAPRPTSVWYVVVDSRIAHPHPLEFFESRSEARGYVEHHPEKDHLRIRRARVQLFHS